MHKLKLMRQRLKICFKRNIKIYNGLLDLSLGYIYTMFHGDTITRRFHNKRSWLIFNLNTCINIIYVCIKILNIRNNFLLVYVR